MLRTARYFLYVIAAGFTLATAAPVVYGLWWWVFGQ
jgi:hypothetical protein